MAKIGLDYGHGFDTFPPSKGVYVNGKAYHEHNFNAKLGLKVKELLESQGHTIIEGQKAYKSDVPLKRRTNLYNHERVDLVWSIHANASGDNGADGRCAFYWGTSKDGKRLAELYVEEVKKAGYSTHGNGLHAGKIGSWTNLHITRETDMPAVLTENGFMSNNLPGTDDDFELIFGSKQEEYTDKMAEVHVKAISRYLGETYKTTTVKPPKKQTGSKTENKKKANLTVDGKWGKEVTKGLQIALDTVVDGVLSDQVRNSATNALYSNTAQFGSGNKGSMVIKALQRKVGSRPDGLLGSDTVRKTQKHLGTPVDGVISQPSSVMVRELQKQLNAGTF